LSGFGEHQHAPLALKQGLPQLLFELFDLGGECRLRHMQQRRRAGEVALFGDRPEVVKVVVIEALHGTQSFPKTERFVNNNEFYGINEQEQSIAIAFLGTAPSTAPSFPAPAGAHNKTAIS
jgi:hypothetical protein